MIILTNQRQKVNLFVSFLIFKMLIDRENANSSCWKLVGLSFLQFKATCFTIMFVAILIAVVSNFIKLMLL